MKPLQLSNEDLSTEFVQSNTLGSDSTDCFGVNVYEFQEGEDLYGTRTRGYQKPKHMWMAKDQALTNIKSNSLTPAATTLDFGSDFCANQGLNSIPPGHLRCPSPTNLTYNMGSPSTSSSIQGLSAAMSSCTNTSSSLCSHTSPVIGPNMTEITSTCASPTFNEVKNDKCSSLIYELNTATKTKMNTKSTTRKRTTVRVSQKKSEPIDSTPSSAPEISRSQPLNDKQSHPHRNRQPRVRTNRKSKRSSTSESVSSSYRVLSPNMGVENHLSLSPNLNMMAQSNQESPNQTPQHSQSLPSSSAFVSGGLKIRLRRDAALDFNVGKGKRTKSKTTPATFRIVESWCDADAPGGDFTRRARGANGSSTSPTFSLVSGGLRVGDIVWAKLAGYPYWPSQVNAIWARTAHQLSQATLFPTSQSLDSNASSLAVLATPPDPSLAAGYTARVDWLAWDQCSYLSCAKLYPFKESFDKLYNPRTRVKGYAEAVRLAKQIVNGIYIPNEGMDSQLPNMSPQNKLHLSLSGQISAPPSTDSQWSSMTTLSSSLELPTTSTNHQNSHELDRHALPLPSDSVPDTCMSSQLNSAPASVSNVYSSGGGGGGGMFSTTDAFSTHSNNSCFGLADKNMELPELGNIAMWAPLPQLDVSGLGVFHVPTFSEDEEEEFDQSIVNQLHLDFGSCLQ